MGPLSTRIVSLQTPATGTVACLKVSTTARGRIRTFRLRFNTNQSVTYALYNSVAAFTVDGSGNVTGLSATAENYRVLPDRTLTNAMVDAAGFGLDYPFENQDGTPTLRAPLLYLYLSGAGNNTPVDVILTIETPLTNG